MAAPTEYTRQYSFQDYQALHPTSPLPADKVDLELNAVKTAVDDTQDNLALIQRNDGRLANRSVGRDQLAEDVTLGFGAPTAWATTTSYTAGLDTVFGGTGFYACEESHISGVFATDLAAGKWSLIADFTDLLIAGPPGTDGTDGVDGATPAAVLTFGASTADSDPGAGVFRLNHATLASATAAYIDNVDSDGNSITGWLDSFDDNNDSARRGEIEFRSLADHGVFAKYAVTGSVVDGTGYRKLALTHRASAGAFSGDFAVLFSAAGDKGAAGAGAGDTITDDVTTTVGRVPAYSTVDKHVAEVDFAKLLAGHHAGGDVNSFGPWSNVASASTCDVGATNTIFVNITGTTTVTSFGTKDNWLRICKVASGFSVTRDATNLETPNQANVTLSAGDVFVATRDSSLAAGKAQIVAIFKADGRAYYGPSDIPQNIAFSGVISPAQITANQNDYSPTGLSAASQLRLSTDASRNVTGLAGGATGRIITICNVGSNALVLKNADASSAAANRFDIGQDITLAAKNCAVLVYDGTDSRWKLLAVSLSFGALALLARVTTIDQNISFTGVITPTQLSANTNDWAPTGFSTCSVIRASTDASRNVTGLAGGTDGRLIWLFNVGTNSLVLKTDDASSTAANRLVLGSDRTLAAGDGISLWYDGTSSRWRTAAVYSSGGGGGGGTVYAAVQDGRLTLATGTPVMTSAVTAAQTLYWTPYRGGQISLYDGSSAWATITSAEVSIPITQAQTGTTTNGSAVITGLTDTSQLIVGMKVSGTGVGAAAAISSIDSATQVTLSVNSTANGTNTITFKLPASTPFDVFGFNNAGALKLEFVAWTNDTTRAVGLTRQNGVPVKTGATTRRYLGTIRTEGTDGQSAFSFGGSAAGGSSAKLFVWNENNRESFAAYVQDSTASWTYNSTTWRAANNSANNRVYFVFGRAASVRAHYLSQVVSGGITARIGVDSTTALTGAASGSSVDSTTTYLNDAAGVAFCSPILAEGFHYINGIERTSGSATCTFVGTGAGVYSGMQMGLGVNLEM